MNVENLMEGFEMGAKLDLTGQKYNLLTAIEDTGKRNKFGQAIADLDAAHKRAENEQP